ncbi:MAG: hypothetical protein D6802_04825 [Ardenticatenia bacterium]|nr:MAG: hypothetical protein D6802_04825 [Ardenticatenia bacterium]
MLLHFRKQSADFAGNRYRVRVESTTVNVHAFEIDVDKQGGYFQVVYQGMSQQPPSADGLVVISDPTGRIGDVVLILEIKDTLDHGARASRQILTTIEHFCRCSTHAHLPYDGQRLHQEALSQPELRLDARHHVVGLYVGGPAQYPRRVRIQQMSQDVCGKSIYLWMHESRRPVIEVSAEALLDELKERFGIS